MTSLEVRVKCANTNLLWSKQINVIDRTSSKQKKIAINASSWSTRVVLFLR